MGIAIAADQMQQFERKNCVNGRRTKYTQQCELVVDVASVTGCQKFNIEKSKIVMANYV